MEKQFIEWQSGFCMKFWDKDAVVTLYSGLVISGL